MGVMLTVMMTPVIASGIPALWGLEGLAAGWVIHLFNSAVLGVAFAVLAGAVGVETDLPRSAGLGIAYGVVLWVVLAAIVMPIWLGAVGFPGTPPLPNFNPLSFVGHLVYGVVLGAAYPSLADL